MIFRTIFNYKTNLVFYVYIWFVLNCGDLCSSDFSESESQESLSLEKSLLNVDKTKLTTQEQHILINVNHIMEFVQTMKKSQDDMFQKIEALANSVKFIDKQGGTRSKSRKHDKKLSALENRMLDFERSIPEKIETLIQQKLSSLQVRQEEVVLEPVTFRSNSVQPKITPIASTVPSTTMSSVTTTQFTPPPPPPPLPPQQLRPIFQIEQPFTPPPLYPIRSSRDATPSFIFGSSSAGSSVGGGGSNARVYSSLPPTRQLRQSSDHHNYDGFFTSPPPIQDKADLTVSQSDETVMSSTTVASLGTNDQEKRQASDMDTIWRKLLHLERTVSEIEQNISDSYGHSVHMNRAYTQNTGTGEIVDIKEKQGQLQRAVDTVLIHFSGIFRALENVEQKIDQCSCHPQNGTQAVHYDDWDVATTLPRFLPTQKTTSLSTTSTSEPYSFNWGLTSSSENPIDSQINSRINPYQHGQDYQYGVSSTDPDEQVIITTSAPYNFADYGREFENNEDDYGEESHTDRNTYNRQSSSNDNWSAERSEPDPETIDFATYAFLRDPQSQSFSRSSKGMLKSLQSVQSDEGTHRPNGRVTRDFSILTRIMKNLTKQLGHQKKRIEKLSSELTKVNVSHVLLLRTMDDETLKRTIRPKDCSEIQLLQQIVDNRKNSTQGNKRPPNNNLKNSNRKFTIFPKQNEPVQVICDLSADSDGGGWTVIQRRGSPNLNGSRRTNFYQNWTTYEQGFGSTDGDYWLGLSNIAALTKLNDHELRIELTKWDGSSTAIASYKHFRLGDATTFYRLHVSNYSGTAGDSLSRHDGMSFSTYDQDQDTDSQRNCAQTWKGSWWFYGCHESNLNGIYATNTNGSHEFGTGIVWITYTGNYYSLKEVQMKIRNRFTSL